MNARQKAGEWEEKANAGWWDGMNSSKTPWLLQDSQYRSGINIINRGGVIQTRPGFRLRLTLPPGNLQGHIFFKPTKDGVSLGECLVFAVDGKVYYSPFPLVQPENWNTFRLKNIEFSATARQVYWAVAEKSAAAGPGGTLSIVPSYAVLMMQDGESFAAYWDGDRNAHLNENAPLLETPRGTWMAFAGERLWVSRGNVVIASDLADPLRFSERLESDTRGDFRFVKDVSGMTTTVSENRQANIIVFTENDASQLLSSILDRSEWASTANFQTIVLPNLGCIAGRSIVNLSGLLWWYSSGGLVSMDSAAQSFLSSQIRYRDIEMATVKRNFAPDLSVIASASFENFLLVSVPSGEALNAKTMVLDYAIASELFQESSPAWTAVWTGTRPVEWTQGTVNGQRRIFQASIDYQEHGGSFNHIWEAFMQDKSDAREITNVDGVKKLVHNRIYCSWESKLLGDLLDYKIFMLGQADLVEMGRIVDLKMSFGGTKGAYHEIFRQRFSATIDLDASPNSEFAALANSLGVFRPQSRRITSEKVIDSESLCNKVESTYPDSTDKAFGLLFQWCGQMGIEAIRIYYQPKHEAPLVACAVDESGLKVLSQDGKSFVFPELTQAEETDVPVEDGFGAFIAPITPRFRDVFYSSIPVEWTDPVDGCVTCLECARDTFEPSDRAVITVNGTVAT